MKDIIDMESYKSGYNAGKYDGYDIGYEHCKKNIKRVLHKRQMIRERKLYFLKQKLTGIALILLAVVVAFVVNWDLMPALFFASLGMILLFTKHMVLANDYYFEHKEEM